MNLRLDRGEISLPKDFKFDIQSNHPFFSNEGTASVPATIPPSQQNRLLLGNPENQHAAHRFTKKLPAQLSHGIYSKRCQIIIDSASEKSGISTSLALQESEMYAELQDKKLQDIFQTTRVHTHYGGLYDYAESWAQGVNGEYVIFPVAADIEDADNADATGSKKNGQIAQEMAEIGELRHEPAGRCGGGGRRQSGEDREADGAEKRFPPVPVGQLACVYGEKRQDVDP